MNRGRRLIIAICVVTLIFVVLLRNGINVAIANQNVESTVLVLGSKSLPLPQNEVELVLVKAGFRKIGETDWRRWNKYIDDGQLGSSGSKLKEGSMVLEYKYFATGSEFFGLGYGKRVTVKLLTRDGSVYAIEVPQ